MTTATEASVNDESETLFWMRMAARVLAGDLDPQAARSTLITEKAESTARRRSVRTTRH